MSLGGDSDQFRRKTAAHEVTRLFFYFRTNPAMDAVGFLDAALTADPRMAVDVARLMAEEPDPLRRTWRQLLNDDEPLVRSSAEDAIAFAREFQNLSEADERALRQTSA